jgi:hypothetical protein
MALGEDPQEFENLKQELRSALTPGDALWKKQIDDLAWLYWRRERLERAEEGLKRRALQAIEDWQHRRRQEMARISFDASQHEMLDVGLSESTDRGVTLRRTLSFLELVREEVKQRTFRPRQYAVLESLYSGTTGWRQALIFRLLHRFGDPMYLEAQQADEEEQQSLRKIGFDYERPGEPGRQELLRLLEEETASVREEFEYAEKANEERVGIERDACLAPEGETWKMMLRQEAALDHSIDRKVRILLRLRKDAADRPVAPASQDQDDGVRVENTEEILDSAIVPEASGSRAGSPQGGTGLAAPRGSPTVESGQCHGSQGVEVVEEPKLNEQSGNVYENKGALWKTGGEAGMLLKTNIVTHNTQECC